MDETVRLVHRVISWRRTVGFKNISSGLVHRHRYARRYCQSGSDRLENQSTAPAAAGQCAAY